MLDKKILFLCKENDAFLIPIINYLRKSYGDLVEIIRVDGNKGPSELFEFVNKCDLAWFEWCSDWCAPVSQGEKYCKMFIRLHSYEAFSLQPPPNMNSIVQSVNWNNIDELIVPNKNVIDVIETIKYYMIHDLAGHGQNIPKESILPNIDYSKINIIPNAVDCNDIRVANNKQRTKKIAWIGFINHKKNFELAIQLFLELLKKDNSFELHIAGLFQDIREKIYYDWITRGIKRNMDGGNIFEYGWVDPEQLNLWLQDKTYILSTSLFESFHHGLAQAMTAGLIPLIHNWPGASNLYPSEFIWETVSEAIKYVENHEEMSLDVFRNKQYGIRKHIVDNYSEDNIMPKIKGLIDSHLYEKEMTGYFKSENQLPEGKFDVELIKNLLERKGRLK